MRVPIPQRFPARSVAVFATILFAGQQMQGTDFFFSILNVIYLFLWAAAFNAAGGIEYTSGAFIFFNGLFTVVLGMAAKVVMWQAGNRNLLNPRSTMICYCLSMAGMWLAATVSSGLRLKRPLLKDFPSLRAMKQASIACLILGVIFVFAFTGGSSAGNGFSSAANQLNRFPFMAILLAVTYEVRRSGGKRSINWVGATAIAFTTVLGIIYFTKEGMLIGPTAWFLAAMLNRFSFTRTQIIGSILGFSFLVYYLVPYSQYVRLFNTNNRAQNIAVSIKYLSDLNETRHLYLATLDDYDLAEEEHLFDQRVGFLDRLIIFAPDDALIHYTNQGNVYGLLPTYAYNVNIIPHFIWKNKPDANFGNLYGHELGIVSEEDFTTGVSFSAAADYYHEAKWLGLLLVLPLELFLAFLVSDSIAGSSRQAPWAMLWILEVSHAAPEGGADAGIYLYTYGPVSMLFTYWIVAKLVPYGLSLLGRNSAATALPMAVSENS